MPPRRCILGVPIILLRHSTRAYTPDAFSIGPFNYNKNLQLKAMQKIISRTHDPKTKLRDLTAAICCEIAEEARECYAGDIGMSMDEFVKVLVLDGCFPIELFRKAKYETLRGEDDPIINVSCMRAFLRHDLILLENQIPWLVLDRLFDMTKTHAEAKAPLSSLVISFFGDHLFSRSTENSMAHLRKSAEKHEKKHILDLLRNSVVNEVPKGDFSKSRKKIIYNWLNTGNVTKFFNQLYNDTFVKDFCYSKLTKDVKDYCRHPWPRYLTVLKRDYFRNPWTLISVLVAAILLILTFLQTVSSVLKLKWELSKSTTASLVLSRITCEVYVYNYRYQEAYRSFKKCCNLLKSASVMPTY
ncbi:hypothetical protein TorRG33x02_088630 [Trema orientale]|uniref:Uncharacterized protein n=1 Tax=Trema orientale TaxID=63057 RepID=A0A2P5FC01_TREOI|nr:hypothetical protein TorRG33x02_088630 [Trema orientale]